MGRCKNCKYFKKNKTAEFIGGLNSGRCSSDKWVVHPNYYTESTQKFHKDSVAVTYYPQAGPDFGCIHFELKEMKIKEV